MKAKIEANRKKPRESVCRLTTTPACLGPGDGVGLLSGPPITPNKRALRNVVQLPTQNLLHDGLVWLFLHALFESFEACAFPFLLLVRSLRGRRLGWELLAHHSGGDFRLAVGDQTIPPPDLVIRPPLLDPQVDPFLRQDRNPLVVPWTNAQSLDPTARKGATERRPGVRPMLDWSRLSKDAMPRVESDGLRFFPSKHPGDTEPDRPIWIVDLPESVPFNLLILR